MKTIKDCFCEGCPFKDVVMGSQGFDRLNEIRKVLEGLEDSGFFLECFLSERLCKVNEVLRKIIEIEEGNFSAEVRFLFLLEEIEFISS